MFKYITVNITVEVLCLIIALFSLNKKAGRPWLSMIPFLFIICLTEIGGKYLKMIYMQDREHNLPNSWLYNLLLIFQALFISLHFKYLIGNYIKSKPLIYSGLALTTLLYFYELFNHGLYEYNTLTNMVLSIQFITFSLYYYYNLLRDDTYVNLRYSAGFWWVTGILFFSFGSIICSLFYYKLSVILITSKVYLTTYIYFALNIILYSCWSYSFICKKWQTPISKR
ncbi:hypothetical protein HDC91_003449 [Mucilaginibacter sp. AK015]|nr:hypothetical protein [Mucilaginibacter sp. AK015]